MSEKHNGNIFETFEASLVVLSIALVKLYFTKAPLAVTFFNQFCPISLDFLPRVTSMTVQTLNTIGQSNLDLEHTREISFFTS